MASTDLHFSILPLEGVSGTKVLCKVRPSVLNKWPLVSVSAVLQSDMSEDQFVFGWKIPGLSSAMNSSVASHVTQEVCQFWKRDFRGPGTKASKAVTPTGGPVVAGAE